MLLTCREEEMLGRTAEGPEEAKVALTTRRMAMNVRKTLRAGDQFRGLERSFGAKVRWPFASRCGGFGSPAFSSLLRPKVCLEVVRSWDVAASSVPERFMLMNESFQHITLALLRVFAQQA